MTNLSGEQLLLQGQQLREQGKTFEALDFLNRALEAFAQEQDYARFAHALLDRGICWQHLYQFNGNDFGFAALYKKDAEAMLEIVVAKQASQELGQAYFMNAKAAVVFKEYDKAIAFFIKAIENIRDRPAQKGDWRVNLGKALYLNGEKEKGVTEMLAGIADIQSHATEVDSYTANVWLSGGYLRLAEALRQDDPAESKKYLGHAKAITDADPQQIIRKRQLETLLKNGSPNV